MRLMRVMLLRGLLGLRLLLVFSTTEDLLEEVLLFGLSGLLRGIGRIAVGRSVRRLPDYGSSYCRRWSSRWPGVGCCRLAAAEAEDLLQEVLRVFAHLAAGIHRCRAVEEANVEAVVGAA